MTAERLSPGDAPEHAQNVFRAALAGFAVLSDEDIAKQDLEERKARASDILGRLPDYLRRPTPAELLERIREPQVRAAARWLPEGGSLLLLGPTARGKSHAAGYCFRRVLGRGVTYGGEAWKYALRLQWFAARDIERARLEHPLGKDEAPEILAACRASMLVIDDVGWDRDPTAVSAVLAERYDAGTPTLITSGLSRAQLVTHYGAAVARRMAEAGGPRVTIVEAA